MKKFLIGGSVFALPMLAFAQYTANNAGGLYTAALDVTSKAIVFIIALAVVYTLVGAFKYAFGDEKEKGKAKENIIYGIIALFVMVSVWGLVNLLSGTFTLTNPNVIPTAPTIPVRPGL